MALLVVGRIELLAFVSPHGVALLLGPHRIDLLCLGRGGCGDCKPFLRVGRIELLAFASLHDGISEACSAISEAFSEASTGCSALFGSRRSEAPLTLSWSSSRSAACCSSLEVEQPTIDCESLAGCSALLSDERSTAIILAMQGEAEEKHT